MALHRGSRGRYYTSIKGREAHIVSLQIEGHYGNSLPHREAHLFAKMCKTFVKVHLTSQLSNVCNYAIQTNSVGV